MEKIKFIIIIGCGRLGSELALKLSENHSVVVIDKDENSFIRLSNRNFTGFTMTVDTSDMDALNRVKLEKADMVYIVTPDDNLNFMLAYGIKNINPNIKLVARVNDPIKKDIFKKANVELFCPIENSVQQLVEDFEKVDKI
ncbi:NAD-binding protein [Oceanotoga sp. DSM 15011]|jgi:trk system potassium uptake protein TrkA|uniref:Trk system potassium uptake protein TrkA n=1 Tax=Oceanotoga teriensis TaxID=515440 RepID=A0AA45C4K9_9BACT|nr:MULTISPECIES: NAD(P)-binding protein [Oceanotoga]MDN5343574.1 trk/ktr system potassium uptake protein [Oceanotoga sp.]MDO7977303.1 NAD-binding protein [Oceanotoga teriensis]PWJ86722.1 trk system potassium uptake protein TrkA [Oceanotoga teriensis]UYP00477.1 NAD-binding protein [Oceanotoga sp. DSM 15011]